MMRLWLILALVLQGILSAPRENIHNERVLHVNKVERPLNIPFGNIFSKVGIKHSGIVVKTDKGNSYLIHKGKGGWQTVATDPKYMSNKWKTTGSKSVIGNNRVGDYIRTGGKSYGLIFSNCNQAAKKMWKTCRK